MLRTAQLMSGGVKGAVRGGVQLVRSRGPAPRVPRPATPAQATPTAAAAAPLVHAAPVLHASATGN